MKHRTRRNGWAAAAAMAALATVVACTDSSPVSSGPPPGGGGTGGPGGPRLSLDAVTCHGNTANETVVCEVPGQNASGDIIVGNQNVYVKVTSSNVNYDAGTQAFTFDVTVRNLIPQPMGTTDGTTLDPNGVRVFFHDGPNVTGGTGAISVVADGTATFTASGQPYYQYNQVLDQYEVSPPKTWQLNMPATVTSFDFRLFISAPVEFPDGYVDVAGNSSVRSGLTRQLAAVVRTAVGNVDSSTTVTWSSVDPTRATVDADSGLVKALRQGTTDVVATTVSGPPRTGARTMTVLAIRRYWTGAAGTSDWNTGANWMPDSIKPEPADTAVVTDTLPAGGTPYPALTQNEQIGGVEVEDLTPGGTVPSISLGAFNLTATGDVCTNSGPCSGGVVFGSASINSTSGSLVLSGIARTMRGLLPRFNVTGTYSLNGNVTASQRIQAQGGRITSTSFRLQQNP